MFMLGISGLSDKLRQLTKPNGERYVIDGDLAMWFITQHPCPILWCPTHKEQS
jgi:hypothetical protein